MSLSPSSQAFDVAVSASLGVSLAGSETHSGLSEGAWCGSQHPHVRCSLQNPLPSILSSESQGGSAGGQNIKSPRVRRAPRMSQRVGHGGSGCPTSPFTTGSLTSSKTCCLLQGVQKREPGVVTLHLASLLFLGNYPFPISNGPAIPVIKRWARGLHSCRTSLPAQRVLNG